MSAIFVTKQLNYGKRLHPSTVGQELGPDTQGRMFTVTEMVDRADDKPGCALVIEWSAGGSN